MKRKKIKLVCNKYSMKMDFSKKSLIQDKNNFIIIKNNNDMDLDQFNNKISDFSIDHILNRAGEKYYGTNNSNLYAFNQSSIFCDKINENQIDKINLSQFNIHQQQLINNSNPELTSPIFDWLQYTRYKPPKLPRPFRNGPVKRTPGRLPRVPFTPSQLSALENAYKKSNYLSAEDANKLATQLDLTNTRVKIWFQNRRARERREKRETGESPDLIMSPVSSPERE